jgi:hypothetical protein
LLSDRFDEMFHNKRKTYQGRKIVQGLQAGLVIAIGLLGLGALDNAFRQPKFVPVQTEVVVVQDYTSTNYVEPQTPSYSAMDYFTMAYNAQASGDYSDAADYYSRSLELDSSNAAAWLNRGVAYEQMIGGVAGKDDFWQYLQRNTSVTYMMELAKNQTTTLEMAEGRMYILTFYAEAGDIVNLSANSIVAGEPGEPGVADPLTVVLDAYQNPVIADDDTLRSNGTLINMDSQIDNYMVMRDGTYTVLLSHAGGGSYGMIDVTLSVR